MSMSLTGASKVPDILWEYCGHIDVMEKFPGSYGMDKMREEIHKRLCQHYKLTKEVSQKVTDNLDKYKDVPDVHDALIALMPE